MNISVQYAEVLVAKIVLLISYFITIPIVGWVRAWVAEKMGDDTPEQLGFLTINPMAHISLLWVCFIMFLTDFGFGKYIPINPLNIHGKWRPARLVAAYLSDAFASIVLAFLALFCFVLFFGADPSIFFRSFFNLRGAVGYPAYSVTSSTGIATGLLLMSFVYFNSMLAAFNIIVNLFYLGFFYFVDNAQSRAQHVEWIMLIGPLILIVVFFGTVQLGILKLIALLGTLLGTLIGAL